jgi:hypothetical protein
LLFLSCAQFRKCFCGNDKETKYAKRLLELSDLLWGLVAAK